MNERVPAAKYAVRDLALSHARIPDTRPELSMQNFRVDDPWCVGKLAWGALGLIFRVAGRRGWLKGAGLAALFRAYQASYTQPAQGLSF